MIVFGSIKKWLQKLLVVAGLDYHVSITILFRSWGIIAGGITALLIPLWLTPEQQGYYYTFASLIALQIFFELGFSQVIVQLVSHEAAHLTLGNDGRLNGNQLNLARLGGIVAMLRTWYIFAATLFIIVGSVIGIIFFIRNVQALPLIDWIPVWLLLVFITGINLYLSPQLAVIEGTGKVGHVAKLRLIQSVFGYASLWMLLLIGAELWVTLAVPLTASIATTVWLRKHKYLLKINSSEKSSISWRRDVFPLQLRIGVSWACGYFIFNLFTPIVFMTQGSIEAGRVGLAMSIFNAVGMLGLSWLNAKFPKMVMHIALGESVLLNQLFKKVAIHSTIATTVLALTIVGIVAQLSLKEISLADRITSPLVLFWIACATIANAIVNAAASYMRAHREEPMLPVSVTSALATAIVLIIYRNNLTHMAMGYALVVIFLTLPWAIIIFRKYLGRHRKKII